jgi:glycerol-3-phosphate O-acyltransferase
MLRRFSERPLRLPRLRPYVPGPDDPAIFWFNSERDDIVREVVERIVDKTTKSRAQMELMLNDTALHESRRLAKQRDEEAKQSLGYWRGLLRRIARMTDEEKRQAIRAQAERMAKDVAGNFDPRVYKMANHVVPRLLTGVMQPAHLPRAMVGSSRAGVDALLGVQGPMDLLRRLAPQASLVYVPTHLSNLDSVVLAYALERQGLPPVVYGAGKNLFSNPIVSFFMHNLGAYRVDRRVQARLYKDVLKSYSCVMIERGYHSLFFPGGTRSRSGLIERKLKLGLAGSSVEAFSRNAVRGIARKVFIVPATINYELVLEAETLVQDWLTEEGQARYIIEDDEFSRLDRWIAFFRKLSGMEHACVIRFGQPLDPFGNPVDEEGESIAPGGRRVDARTYVARHGKPTLDSQRDEAYTRGLGEILVKRYAEETVIMATPIVAHILYRRLVHATPGLDLFARLRLRGDVTMPRQELIEEIDRVRQHLVRLEERGVVHLSDFVRAQPAEELLDRALSVWSGYHDRIAARDLGGEVTVEDPRLLLYYQNRMVPFAADLATDEYREAALDIASMQVPR